MDWISPKLVNKMMEDMRQHGQVRDQEQVACSMENAHVLPTGNRPAISPMTLGEIMRSSGWWKCLFCA